MAVALAEQPVTLAPAPVNDNGFPLAYQRYGAPDLPETSSHRVDGAELRDAACTGEWLCLEEPDSATLRATAAHVEAAAAARASRVRPAAAARASKVEAAGATRTASAVLKEAENALKRENKAAAREAKRTMNLDRLHNALTNARNALKKRFIGSAALDLYAQAAGFPMRMF